MLEFTIGRCKVTVELNTPSTTGNLNGYDLVVSDARESTVVKVVCTNLMKFNEQGVVGCFWFENAVELAKRYTILKDALDMANYNLMCYSTNLLMDTPRSEYSNEWHEELEKIKTLEKWIKELSHTIYMPPKGEK